MALGPGSDSVLTRTCAYTYIFLRGCTREDGGTWLAGAPLCLRHAAPRRAGGQPALRGRDAKCHEPDGPAIHPAPHALAGRSADTRPARTRARDRQIGRAHV